MGKRRTEPFVFLNPNRSRSDVAMADNGGLLSNQMKNLITKMWMTEKKVRMVRIQITRNFVSKKDKVWFWAYQR